MGATKDADAKDDGPTEETGLVKKEYKGEPFKYDPTFKGPIKNRSCTDIICCLLFFVFILGLVAVAFLAFSRGDPKMLLYPTDSEGNICGTGKFTDRPNLFFFDLLACARMGPAVAINGCPTPQVCVKSCPTNYWTFIQDEVTNNRNNLICLYDVDPKSAQYSSKSLTQLVQDKLCAGYTVKSVPMVGRCVPAIFTTLLNKTQKLVSQVGNQNFTLTGPNNETITGSELEQGSKYLAIMMSAMDVAQSVLADLEASWWMLIVGLVISAIIALIWILIMRWIAGVMVWLSLILFIALFAFGTYYGFKEYVRLKDSVGSQGALEFKLNLSYYAARQETWLAIGIICAVILGIVLLILLILRNRIRIAISIIKETSKVISYPYPDRAVGNMMFTLLWPLFPFVLQLGVFGLWGAITIFLASSGKAQSKANVTTTNSSGNPVFDLIDCSTLPANSSQLKFCHFVKYGGNEYTIYLQIYNLFMLFWLMNFVVALGQMTLAGAFASYYWAFSKPADIPAFPLSASFWRCIRYHLGSIAFGSLIIAIIQLIRAMLEYLDHKLKGSENPVAKFFLKCLKCFFWCLEKFMKFLNKNAYILIAVYGKNFCTSAKNAFFLILRNIVRVVVIDKVTDFVIFIAKLVVVGATTVAAFFFFDGRIPFISNYSPNLQYNLVPVIVIAIGSYIIAACFFSVYNMGVDTLFLCFLEDLERHDGSPEKPYYMSKELMRILGKKNKKPKATEKEAEKDG
ncbi:choline transporter-like protein 2 isoform X3 [Tubulanus polymorphus]|uniref:choline transporter-like protein 2 isoform X3 n=1 Tax=Tubulanus polymorphus TaxID=672921 RepID=UPI003DA65984